MLRTIAFPFVSVLLIFSLLASPLIPFLDKEFSKTLVLSAEEEKSSKKEESEKKFDEKDFFIKNYFAVSSDFLAQDKHYTTAGYLFPVLEYTVEILDPPPRRLI
ncbi:hypothetical protein [Muricauda sp. MAR_2010_75]|uniref:hypothetical protein n=1 Tax=Allomuricauda sp. MAR_2010_75 TaxID=1250232 RepID=UPI0012DFFA9E|nr:hypothetical protein [Muricauda sp. MAR_2010_75]